MKPFAPELAKNRPGQNRKLEAGVALDRETIAGVIECLRL